MIKKMVNVEFNPTIDELASLFVSMEAEQQAEFFNKISLLLDITDNGYNYQLEKIVYTKRLNKGKSLIKSLGLFIEKYDDMKNDASYEYKSLFLHEVLSMCKLARARTYTIENSDIGIAATVRLSDKQSKLLGL